MLALFWLTSWGMGAIDAELVNRERFARQALEFSRLEVLALREQVRLLEAERGRYAVAANAPAFGNGGQGSRGCKNMSRSHRIYKAFPQAPILCKSAGREGWTLGGSDAQAKSGKQSHAVDRLT